MSGLLRRLANRARSGRGRAVHAMARMPYAPPPLLHESEMRRSVKVPTPPRESESVTPIIATPATPDPSHVPEPVDEQDHRKSQPPQPVKPIIGHDPPRNHPPRPVESIDVPSEATADQQATGEQGETEPERPIPTNKDRVPDEIVPPEYRERFVMIINDAEALPAETVPNEIVTEFPPLKASMKSRGKGPGPTNGQRKHIRGRLPKASPANDHEPDEVHVHIGRIEVTAITEKAPPKPIRRAEREPMSLEEYLEKRRQGRST
jgi:hypothetical protein